jgi:hypothetical protein
LQVICTVFLISEVTIFPPSYFSPGALGDKLPVGSVNSLRLNKSLSSTLDFVVIPNNLKAQV